ncbi:carbohydrate-binding family 9-like protein [Mucilaginibacter sp.]|uniref:carbohydrate-binding family 9-like protein n=1 Tax=Mucilaginibacter sp. TaxID=1882438 RepID=UPI00284762D2|nr:carbohydrate-binding family 9-like protein [Mucilaginibacter sp.]MDR3694477.1 carbohydrate-binding family 9-like protein [Mucilaginibacter sp.]
MKYLRVPFVSTIAAGTAITDVSLFLNEATRHSINNLLWSNSGYKPNVSFAIAYTTDSILLKYFVTEKYITSGYHEINDPVFEDTCVEFFIAFGDERNYYNLEFNRIGTPLVGYGPGKNNRTLLEKPSISQIKSLSKTASQADAEGDTEWELTLSIPFSLFVHNNIKSLTGGIGRVNLFKCGDNLPDPHFLSWNYIDNPQPNFHLPEFFGKIQFL